MSDTVVRVPAGARWDCRACGDCCRLYELGPVEPGIIRGLEERRIQDHWAPAAAQPWYEVRRAPDGREAHFLTHKDGHCVFLRDDNLCAVHGLFGADAKPAFCREYPFHVVDDPRGSVVVVRPSCSGLHDSGVDGKPLAEHVPDVLALPRVMPRRRLLGGEIALLPGHVVPLARYMELEAELLALLDGPAADPEVLVARLRGALQRATGEKPAPADPRKARLAAGAVLEALRRLMVRAASPEPGQDPHRVVFAQQAAALLERGTRGLASPAPLAQGARDYQQQLLRTFLLAKGFQALGGVAEGLGFFLVQSALVRAAAEAGPDGIGAREAGPIVVKWTKLTENPAIQGVLKLTRPALIDLFGAV